MTTTKVYCDRCGREIKTKLVNQIRVLDYDASDTFVCYDICKSCIRAFNNLMAKRVIDYSDITRD